MDFLSYYDTTEIKNDNNIMLYGTFLYGEKIYHDCSILAPLFYDFQISIHDLSDESLLPNVNWELYRRDDLLDNINPIDDTHILVDHGTSITGLLQIDLQDYNLRTTPDEYYICVWRVDNPEVKSDIYIRYYPDDYIDSDVNQPYLVNKTYLSKAGLCSGGEIQIEPMRWQMISIPVRYGYWDTISHNHIHDETTVATIKNYVVDQINDVYGGNASDMVEIFNTYIGDIHRVYNYVVGHTIDNSIHNFPLAYIDDGDVEYVGIWVKSIHTSAFTIKWGI